jgi:hypothetical protein
VPVPACVDEDVEVDVSVVPEPDPPHPALVDEDVEVDACALGVFVTAGAAVEPPAEVEQVDPVFVAADELPDPDWLPAEEVVLVCALELPDPAWVAAVVLVCAVEPPDPAWLAVDVDVHVWAVELPDPALLPAAVVVLFCAFELPEDGWLEGVEQVGVVVAEVLVVVRVDLLPVD